MGNEWLIGDVMGRPAKPANEHVLVFEDFLNGEGRPATFAALSAGVA
jgi:hypothetical protein